MVNRPTGAGVGSLLDASCVVPLSSFEVSFGELGGRPASMRSARRACQLFMMSAILCRRRDERHFHHGMLLAVTASVVVVEGGRKAEVHRGSWMEE